MDRADMTTTRETADHIGEADEKVVQTPMHRDAAKAAIALKVSGRADHIGDATTMIDHAELMRLAEAAKRVRRDSMGNLDGTDAWRRWEAFSGAANPATVLALLSEIAALRVRAEHADALASKHFVALREKQDDAAFLKHGKLEAERQRDELRKALEPSPEMIRVGAWRAKLHREANPGDTWEDTAREVFSIMVAASDADVIANQGADQ